MLLVPNTTNLPSVMTFLPDSYSSDCGNGVVSQLHSLECWHFHSETIIVGFSPDVISALLVYKTKQKTGLWQFDPIIMQNKTHNLLLFCAPTWSSYHVIFQPSDCNELRFLCCWIVLKGLLLIISVTSVTLYAWVGFSY